MESVPQVKGTALSLPSWRIASTLRNSGKIVGEAGTFDSSMGSMRPAPTRMGYGRNRW